MSGVASKNLYDLLGNDPDQDPELRTEPPVITPVDKPAARKGKRDVPTEAPPAPTPAPATDATRGRGRGRGGRGRGRGGRGGNDEAFLDSDLGRARNRDRPVEEGAERLRGNRRGRSTRGTPGDRHSRSIHSGPDDQAKQAAHGWGGNTGESEWNDEAAGDAIAREEQREGNDSLTETPVNADGERPTTVGENDGDEELEPEDKTKSYADYLAEQAERKLQLGGNLQARKVNEGSSSNLPEGKAFEKEEDDYISAATGKIRRGRERKEKNLYVLEHDIQAREQPSPRGGRGGRGGRGRGEFRGRGGGRARGEPRGRGGRGGQDGPSPNVTNSSDFPSLGS